VNVQCEILLEIDCVWSILSVKSSLTGGGEPGKITDLQST